MPLSDHIVVDPEILAGKPVIRGTRLAVEFILELLAAGQSETDLLMNYPGLSREDILACLSYASYLAHEYKAYPIPA
uniref:Antitoxin n=1 Tax=Solibacter usitatus (strain Ellin6076) TaxID=234267 RepID=Q01QL1_SOLUE